MYNLLLLPSVELIGLSVQEKKRKIYFQDGSHGIHFGFLIRTILAIFRSTGHHNASYHVSLQLAFRIRRRSTKKVFPDVGHGGYFGLSIGTILAIFINASY